MAFDFDNFCEQFEGFADTVEGEIVSGDDGIGSYEYWGSTGYDSRPYCYKAWTGTLSVRIECDEPGPEDEDNIRYIDATTNDNKGLTFEIVAGTAKWADGVFTAEYGFDETVEVDAKDYCNDDCDDDRGYDRGPW